MKTYTSFTAFYPFSLSQHHHPVCRRPHVVCSLGVLALLAWVIASGQWLGLLALPVLGYGFAWVGHYVFERNRPATFTYPLYSLMGDWVMLFDVLSGRSRRWPDLLRAAGF